MSRLSLTPDNALSSATAPVTPTLRAGDFYYDSALGTLRVYSGSAWISLANQDVEALAWMRVGA